ncbi:MAG: hypothetical protein AAGI91_07745 [Bacteroidota bacterium]
MMRCALLLLAVLAADAAVAQALPPTRGETVRLVVRDRALRHNTTVVGTFNGLGPDSLYLTDQAYARSLVRRVEVGRKKQGYAVTGAGIGLGLGGLTGALIGAVEDQEDFPAQGETRATLQKGLFGVIIGGTVGAIIGSFIYRTKWEWVQLDGPGSARAVRVSYTLPLR